MSEYTSTNYDFDSSVSLAELADNAGLQANVSKAQAASTVAQNVRSMLSRYRAYSDKLQANSSLLSVDNPHREDLQHHLKALAETPVLAAATRAEARELFESLDRVMATSSPTNSIESRKLEFPGCHQTGIQQRPITVPSDALESLTQAIEQGSQRLMVAEATLLRDKAKQSLLALGYSIATPRRPQIGALQLRGSKRSGPAVTMEIAPAKGQLQFDLSGFCGDACSKERDRLLNELRKRGISLTICATDRHGRREGSKLTARFDAASVATPSTRARAVKLPFLGGS